MDEGGFAHGRRRRVLTPWAALPNVGHVLPQGMEILRRLTPHLRTVTHFTSASGRTVQYRYGTSQECCTAHPVGWRQMRQEILSCGQGGIETQHSEFIEANGQSRVEIGANMTVDPDIADAVTTNEEEPPITLDYAAANFPCSAWQTTNPNARVGHDTAAASVLGGNTTGVAKNVTIVPVKVAGCDTDPHNPGGITTSKLAMARGLDFVIADMQGRPGRAVVSMSIFADTTLNTGHNLVLVSQETCEASFQSSILTNTNCVSALENEVNNVIGANIPVVVSANNRNDGECRTTPARMGYGNEAAFPSTFRTITVGGTMYEPGTYVDKRWTCDGTPAPNPTSLTACDSAWASTDTGYGLGSNYGPCVSIWAPAWNLHVAGASGPNSFRTPGGASSGTSWSAPYTAGVVARLLEGNPMLTPLAVWQALVTRATNQRFGTPDFDPSAVVNNKLVYISRFE